MTPPKNYIHRTWQATLLLIALLVGVSFIPPASVGGIRLRRANILSELIDFNDPAVVQEDPMIDPDAEEFTVDLDRVAEELRRAAGEHAAPQPEPDAPRAEAPDPAAEPEPDPHPDTPADSVAAPRDTTSAAVRPAGPPTTYLWEAGPADAPEPPASDTARRSPVFVPVEDADTTGRSPLEHFYHRLACAAEQPVRIAVLGDSFIEGDILTADLREALQERYGGHGPGFAPMASPLTGFRRTVKTRSTGWTTYNLMQRKSTPEALRDRYFVSGWVSTPSPGAETRWELTDAQRRLDRCEQARVLFTCRTPGRVTLSLNDTLTRSFAIEPSEAARQIVVRGAIRSLALRVDEGAEGFTGYGAVFGDRRGVTLDNYSVRSNNGQAMFGTSPTLNAQFNRFGPYDLVILQYGLNIMQEGVTNYAAYSARVEQMIAFVRQCFPSAAVLVIGVSDRSVKGDDGRFRPMSSAPALTQWQRHAAERTGAAFWSTYDAMRALGGMERFVREGWAGKDYTHINFGGGRQVALALFDALERGVQEARATLPADGVAPRRAPVLRKSDLRRLERRLFPKPSPPEPAAR